MRKQKKKKNICFLQVTFNCSLHFWGCISRNIGKETTYGLSLLMDQRTFALTRTYLVENHLRSLKILSHHDGCENKHFSVWSFLILFVPHKIEELLFHVINTVGWVGRIFGPFLFKINQSILLLRFPCQGDGNGRKHNGNGPNTTKTYNKRHK